MPEHPHPPQFRGPLGEALRGCVTPLTDRGDADRSRSIPPRLALLVRRALNNAAVGGADVDESGWRRERDSLEDLLEPVTPSVVTSAELRRIVDLLSEAAPSEQSRMSVDEWRADSGEVIAQLSALS